MTQNQKTSGIILRNEMTSTPSFFTGNKRSKVRSASRIATIAIVNQSVTSGVGGFVSHSVHLRQ